MNYKQKLIVTVGVISLRFPFRYRVYEQEDTLYVTKEEIKQFRQGNRIWKIIIQADAEFKNKFIRDVIWLIDREITLLNYTFDDFMERLLNNSTCIENIHNWFRYINYQWTEKGYSPKGLLQTQKIL